MTCTGPSMYFNTFVYLIRVEKMAEYMEGPIGTDILNHDIMVLERIYFTLHKVDVVYTQYDFIRNSSQLF